MTPITRNILWISALSILEALQLVVVLALIYSFFPISTEEFQKHMFAVYTNNLRPEREMFFYHVFVFAALVIQGALVLFLRKRLNEQALCNDLRAFILFLTTLMVVQMLGAFKIFIYGGLAWAKGIFYLGLALSILGQMFWPELRRVRLPQGGWMFDGSVCLFIFLSVYVFNVERIPARILVWGNGVFSPMDLLKLKIFMVLAIAYLIGVFFLLRVWLQSRLLALAGLCLIMKWQFFHLGTAPICWAGDLSYIIFSLLALICFVGIAVGQRQNKNLWANAGIMLLFIVAVVLISKSSGPDGLSLLTPLRGGQFHAFFIQWLIPIVFAAAWWLKPRTLLGFASAYGLAAFSVHVKDSSITQFYGLCALPLGIVILGVFDDVIKGLAQSKRRMAQCALAAVCTVGLLTNTLFIYYPNIFNLGQVPWDKVVAFYHEHQK